MPDKTPVERLYRDGKTAVLISPGFGSLGWSSLNSDHEEFLLFDRQLCQFVLDGNLKAVQARCDAVCGEDEVYAEDLRVEWVLTGSPFYVHAFDGKEWIVTDFKIA